MRPCGSSLGMRLAALFLLVSGALAHPAAAQEKPVSLVALGDSLTAGYGLPSSAAFPTVLERTLKQRGHNVSVVNAGVSGDTSTGGLERLEWSIPDGTDGVILALGANDMLRGLDPAKTKANLDAMVERLQKRNIPVLLAGMYAARNLGADYAAAFDAIYPGIAQKRGVVLYPFFLDGVAGQRQLNLPDGIHPNADGVKIMVERILPTVEAFLARLRS
jgi:acyl-CoA thioesterase-1